ncbi:MAG TPA: hypothetical protein VFT59_00630 [Candidatus Saccharimonadales bacterium]|nr:hypothetical protein [Candidatus Saccharimonadales bacterium]
MSFSTGNVLNCIAFSHGKGPRSVAELLPLVGFMSRVNSLILITNPVELLGWTVLCGWELEKQYSELVKTVEWPDWDADDTVHMTWCAEQIAKYGDHLLVRALPEDVRPDTLQFDELLKFDGIMRALFARLNIG